MIIEDDSIILTTAQINALKAIVSASTTPVAIVTRAKIVLFKAEGKTTYYVVKNLKITWKKSQRWVKRWQEIIFPTGEYNLKKFILESLKDAPRSGRKPIFTPEQKIQIVNVACRSPESYGLPISHWTIRSLAKQVKELQIVPSISRSRIAVFLKSKGIKTT